MYHFEVEKTTQNILCYSDKDNTLIATSESPFDKNEKWDFLTSIRIYGELFDISISFDESNTRCYPKHIALYSLRLGENEIYETIWESERLFPLKFKRK